MNSSAVAVSHAAPSTRVFQAEGKDSGSTNETPLGKRGLKLRVMIVEDEPVISMDLSSILVQLGAEVVGTAATAAEAIRMADQLRPQLALTDVRIKGEPDGIETARIIRLRHDVLIVFVTGNSDLHTMRRMQAVPGAQIVLKPILSGELLNAIVRACDG